MRVGDLAADDGNKVGLTAGQDGFGVVGGSDPGFGGYPGVLNKGFQLRGQGGGQLFAAGEGGDDAFEFQIAAVADCDIVDMAGAIVQIDDFAKIFST